MNNDECVLYILGALAHLVSESGNIKVFGLEDIRGKVESRWRVDITLREVVIAKKWLLDNELVDDRGIGYSLNELGEEYLRFKLPEFLPLPPMSCHDRSSDLATKTKLTPKKRLRYRRGNMRWER